MQPTCKMNLLYIGFYPVPRWVWGLAIGVPVAAALAYILFGPDTEVVHQNIDLDFFNIISNDNDLLRRVEGRKRRARK